MSQSILNYFSTTHGSFLHAKGRAASARLLELLNCQPGEKILELGVGTGATLTHLAALHHNAVFAGYDASEKMLQVARRRLKFCLLKNRVNLQLICPVKPLPAPAASFDKIFVESVLGIQPGDQLNNLLQELNRVLKVNGTLVFNETIWLDTITAEEASMINKKCLSAFGIIQSNADYPHLSDWKKLLHKTGFEVELAEVAGKSNTKSQLPYTFKGKLLSEVFNLSGKLKSLLKPQLRREWRSYSGEMAGLFPPGKQAMEGYIVKAVKKNS